MLRWLHCAAILMIVPVPVRVCAQDTRDGELEVADQQLNATYRALMRRLAPNDQATLKVAQRAWLAFRDADCNIGWGDRRDCLIQRTGEREKQFKTSVYFDAEGKAITLR